MREAHVPVTVEASERGLLSVEAALHASADREMHARGAVIGAVREILLRPSPEFGVGQHQRVVPAPDFDERGLERDDAGGEVAQQTGLRRGLSRVGVEAGQRDADHRDAGGCRDHLRRRADRVAESAFREFRRERATRPQMRRSLHDVRFDLQDVRQRAVACDAFGCGEARLSEELIGVGERDRTRARRR